LWVVIIWVLVFGRFVLGAPDPRSWILVAQASFLGVLSWALLVRALLVLGITSSGPGGFRLTRLLRVVAGELWLVSCA